MTKISVGDPVAIDSHTYLYWPLQEAPGTTTNFVQLGTAGANSDLIGAAAGGGGNNFGGSVTAANYNPSGTAPVLWCGKSSPTGYGVDFIQHNAADCVYLVTSGEPFQPGSTTTVSVHGWFKIHVAPTSGQFFRLISNWCDVSGIGSSPDALAILLSNTGSQLYMYAQGSSNGTSSGSLLSLSPTTGNFARNGLNLHTWHHVAFTFNSGTAILYLDGEPIGQGAWGGGGHSALVWGNGNWSLGGSPVNSTQTGFDGVLSDWRVETTVRPGTYFNALYQRGIRG